MSDDGENPGPRFVRPSFLTLFSIVVGGFIAFVVLWRWLEAEGGF